MSSDYGQARWRVRCSKVEADKVGGLESYVVLARDTNIWQELGLEISKAFLASVCMF
jgi:hypothetical protein